MEIIYLADRPEWLQTLAGWHHGQWSHYNPGDTLQKRVHRMQSHLGRRRIPTTFVAVSGSALWGSASLVEHDMHDRVELSPWLASVYVAPEHRRQGVGSALVNRVVTEAQQLGFATLYLFTPDQENLYSRLGWNVLERTRYMGLPAVIMSIALGRGSDFF